MEDFIEGMLMAIAIADTISIPYKLNPTMLYNPNHCSQYTERNHGRKRMRTWYAEGTTTDKTAMSLTLCKALIDLKSYSRDAVVQRYLHWCNEGGAAVRTPRNLEMFKGIKTASGWLRRRERLNGISKGDNTALTRCFPLVIFKEIDHWITDCTITNEDQLSIDCNVTYLSILRNILCGYTVTQAATKVLAELPHDEIKTVLQSALNHEFRDVTDPPTSCLNTLWCAVRFASLDLPLAETIDRVILYFRMDCRATDCNTNAVAAAALVGAQRGAYELNLESRVTLWRSKVESVSVSQYDADKSVHPKRIPEYAFELAKLFEC